MQKLFLLLGLSLLSLFVHASCCSFELAYTPEVLVVPAEETILVCLEERSCDSLFLFAGRMIRAYEAGELAEVSRNFESALTIIEGKSKDDSTSLKIVYLYATFMERAGESKISASYYQFIEQFSKEESALKLLAGISLAGIKNDIKELSQLKKLTIKSINQKGLNSDERLAILIRAYNYLGRENGYAFFQKNLVSSAYLVNNTYSELHYLLLIKLIAILAQKEDESYNTLLINAEKILPLINKEKYYPLHLRVKFLVAIANNQYLKALQYSESRLESYLKPTESIEGIISNPPEYSVEKYKSIQSYAAANLFQTRVRPGIEPVKKAFDLYEMMYKRKLDNSLSSVNGLIADKLLYVPSYEMNILIVGYYLYQKTGDLSYLSRAVSVLDGNIGAGNYYWAAARKLVRSNDAFWEDILLQRTATKALATVEEKTSLSELFSAQKTFTQQREKIRVSYPGFFADLTEKNSIDLEEVSNWCAQDSSSVLAFYMQNGELYRLLVSPDTISMMDMYKLEPQVISLAEALTTSSDPKTKIDTDASRELYNLLFSDIDSLLPPNLHIIATGELENVPFNALRREAPGEPARYLGVEVALSRQMSIGSMRLMQEQEMTPRYNRPLGMAPAFNNEVLAVSELRQAGFVLPPLLYSTDEIKDLEERGPGNFFYGEKATLPNYLANVSDHSIIHLATHAISSQTDGLESRIYLTSEGGETSELYISDIGDQTLNADLVVLSACETGSGSQHTTEGRISLTKAYLAAGARSVVSSNWAVDDFATAALMKFFYQHIQEGKPPHQALQLSRKAYLEKYPDAPPYKWAAFDAYGGMKTVRWDRSRSKWPLVGYGALGLATLGLATAFYRRRRKAGQRA